ncbi:hypothetical protein OH76DRAFT_157358 [Lentinus brumalis]|uniref:DUF302 domain-containing protein n=1 Tax=Lentinus brumalis TaxID=2498619 RepID=A0A371DIS9_9APHY|nr:hypothetical protein OH76DRAFT_157358 [Polyporus brumalis]
MSKTVVEYTARRVTYETSLSIKDVLAKLDTEINKPGGGPSVFRFLREANTKADLEEGFNTLTAGGTFVYFAETAYHRFLNAYFGTTSTPQTYVYVFGNPLIAQSMLKHDLTGALHVPLSVLITEKADGTGTKIVYDDPTSTIPVPASQGGPVNADLQAATDQLTQKLEKLLQTVLG